MKCVDVKISVIMSVYNTPKEYLDIAISSIIKQDFYDFEFIIINDGSSEECSKNILEHRDERIKLIINEANIGLTKSLNKGLEIAQGKYIARMDADDYSYPQRLRLQYEYMEKHPEIDILGSWIKEGKRIEKSFGGVTSEWRYARMLFDNAGIYHPTAFIRRSFLKKYQLSYNENILKAQDFELWSRCLEFGKMYVFPQVLLNYRIHDQQISRHMAGEQSEYSYLTRKQLLLKLNIGLEEMEEQQFKHINTPIMSAEQFECFLQKILNANKKYAIFNKEILKYELNTKWIIHMLNTTVQTKKEYFRGKYLYHLLDLKYYIYMLVISLQRQDIGKRNNEK